MAVLVKIGSKSDMLATIAGFSGQRLRDIPAGEVFTAVDPKTKEKCYLLLMPVVGLSPTPTYKVLRSATCACD